MNTGGLPVNAYLPNSYVQLLVVKPYVRYELFESYLTQGSGGLLM